MSDGATRLEVGSSNRQIELLRELSDILEAPFRILYVLIVPQSSQADGRYESPDEFDWDTLSQFLERYRVVFEQDGRHSLWVTARNGQLIFTRHDIVYAYGPIDEYATLLRERGFIESAFTMPAPHVHYYHSQFDPIVRDILLSRPWRRYPLEEIDEET
jgi:hypothetical protein